MATPLPYSRTVNVTVARNGGFPTRRGFGVPLFLTSTEVTGELDSDNLTKVYGSIDEVAVDFETSDDFYKAANAAFSQNPRPLQIKAGWYDDTTVTDVALIAALDAIFEFDNQWYWLCIESALRDIAGLDGIVEWAEAKNKQALLDSNDALHESVADATNVSARHKNTVERTSVFYHTDATLFPAYALAAKLGTFNFDEAGSFYTAKFKQLAGITPVNLGSAKIQAITGFVLEIGQSVGAGHMANTYVDIGGENCVVEGSTLTPNVFIDEIHATDWIIARTEEKMLEIFLNNSAIPFTDAGMQLIADAPRTVMEEARRAGLVANDLDPLTGDYKASVVITIPSVFDAPESQRKARIAPAIAVTFRYAGAVHYSTINYSITF